MPTNLPERKPRTEGEELGRALGMLTLLGVAVTLFLVCVWMVAFTCAHAVRTAMGVWP